MEGDQRQINIRTLTADDIPFGLHLSAQNGWNQLEADWRRQLDLEPAGGFVAELDGLSIGTACCCVFDAIAWISLVLVERDQRGQGVGTALMRHVLQYLDERGVLSIRLDATPLGQPVYAKVGFVGDFALTRYQGVMPALAQVFSGAEPMTRVDLSAVCQMDQDVTQTRRAPLLRRLFDAAPDSARKHAPDGKLEGYCLARVGARAWQIGPLKGSPEAGRALLLDAASRFAGQPVFLDVPADHADAVAQVRALGLTPQRSFLRMTRGRRIAENIERFWCSFGPEKG